MFKKATQLKLRFKSAHGPLTTEDLYDIPLTELDAIAVECQKKVSNEAVSFIADVAPVNAEAELRFEIVQEVIKDRLAVRKDAYEAQVKAQRKQKLMAVLAAKQDEEVAAMSKEDIQKMIAEL